MDEYSRFNLNGVLFVASGPSSDEDPMQWNLRVTRGETLLKEVTIPLMFRPVFGYDFSDIASLEDKTEEIIKELGLE